MAVWNSWTETPRAAMSPLEYFDYREQLRSFEHFGVSAGGAMTLTGAGEPVRIPLGVVSHGVLPALGVAPQLGRLFTPEEDTPNRNLVDSARRRPLAAPVRRRPRHRRPAESCSTASPSPSSG